MNDLVLAHQSFVRLMLAKPKFGPFGVAQSCLQFFIPPRATEPAEQQRCNAYFMAVRKAAFAYFFWFWKRENSCTHWSHAVRKQPWSRRPRQEPSLYPFSPPPPHRGNILDHVCLPAEHDTITAEKLLHVAWHHNVCRPSGSARFSKFWEKVCASKCRLARKCP